MAAKNIINHIVLAIDASSSMSGHTVAVVKVADGLVKHLADRSQQQKQETRVTVYAFNGVADCLIWDMDVLRLPSIATLYSPHGNTALIDASLLAMKDLALTPEKYGDHAFLLYVITDGEENSSKNDPRTLQDHIRKLPENWTIGALVPNITGQHEAKRFGFPAGNIQIWDTTSRTGVEEVGVAVAAATDNYMTMRSSSAHSGVRSTTTLFGGSDQVNQQTVAALGLKPTDYGKYQIVHIPGTTPEKTWISNFVRDTCGQTYRLGSCFYELSKRERIQASKEIAVLEVATDKVFKGREARQLLGLPDTEIRVSPGHNAKFKVFVQSTSLNRHLVPNTKLLIFK